MLQVEDAIRSELGLPGLILSFDRAWGSSAPGSRAAIRWALARDLRTRSWPKPSGELEEQFKAIENLELRPKFPFAQISLSHCRPLGGYAFLPDSGSLGLDLEEAGRITREACERISAPDEIPKRNFFLLWSAKEAAYKALGLESAPISAVRILDWREAARGGLTFQAQGPDGAAHATGFVTTVTLSGEKLGNQLTVAVAHSSRD